jgi:hypothetical protein
MKCGKAKYIDKCRIQYYYNGNGEINFNSSINVKNKENKITLTKLWIYDINWYESWHGGELSYYQHKLDCSNYNTFFVRPAAIIKKIRTEVIQKKKYQYKHKTKSNQTQRKTVREESR